MMTAADALAKEVRTGAWKIRLPALSDSIAGGLEKKAVHMNCSDGLTADLLPYAGQ